MNTNPNNMFEEFENPLRFFDGTGSAQPVDPEWEMRELNAIYDSFMPWGCKSYDEYEGIDEYELLGKED